MAGSDNPNATMTKFGAPATCVAEYAYWTVLLRPKQATLGALILAARPPASAFGELDETACSNLAVVTEAIETALQEAFGFDKINYLMLMMNDPDVHFHVLPRYAQAKPFNEMTFTDPGWPGPPDLGHVNDTDATTNEQLVTHLRTYWPDRQAR